jgi:hypothetical protein
MNELEINKTPIDERDPCEIAAPVPIPEPPCALASITVEFQIMRVSIDELPAVLELPVPIPEPVTS